MSRYRSRTAPAAEPPVGTRILLSCLLLGVASGLRSLAAPSQLSRTLAGRDVRTTSRASAALSRPLVSALLQIAAVGEMVVDKLPTVPDRIEPGPLVGRAFFGGFSGSVLAGAAGGSPAAGAAVGALGAVAGAHAGYRVRRRVVAERRVPDAAVALAEDAVALLVARRASRASWS